MKPESEGPRWTTLLRGRMKQIVLLVLLIAGALVALKFLTVLMSSVVSLAFLALLLALLYLALRKIGGV